MSESVLPKLERAIEQGIVDRDAKDINVAEELRKVAKADTKSKKATAAFSILNAIMPDQIRQKIKKSFGYSIEGEPFSPTNYELDTKIGHGGVSDVFLLRSTKPDKPSVVLKVRFEADKSQSVDGLVATATEEKEEYERIASAYNGIAGLVPAEHYLIIEDPRSRKNDPVVAMIQPFMAGEIRDIFDFMPSELKELLQQNEGLRAQLNSFVDATKNDPSLLENELDLLGNKNLSIVGDEGHERLVFLDPHFRRKGTKSPEKRAEIAQRFSYLESMVVVEDQQMQQRQVA